MTAEEAATAAGITYRQIDYWARTGYLLPDQPRNPGTGNARDWTAEEIGIARDMRRLAAAGLTVEAAHDVARHGDPERVLAALWGAS